MTTILTAIAGVVLAGATVVGVTHAVGNTDQRPAHGETKTSKVVPYGTR